MKMSKMTSKSFVARNRRREGAALYLHRDFMPAISARQTGTNSRKAPVRAGDRHAASITS
jgi:hypothetical protein